MPWPFGGISWTVRAAVVERRAASTQSTVWSAKSASVCSAPCARACATIASRELAAIERVAARRGDLLQRRGHRRAARTSRRAAARGRAAGSARRIPGRAAAAAPPAPTCRRRPATPGSRRARSGSPARTGRRTAACRSAATARPSPTPRRESSPPPSRAAAICVWPGVARGRDRGRRAARGVEPGELAAVPDDREEVAADAVAAGLDDRQRDRRGERRVDGIAAALRASRCRPARPAAATWRRRCARGSAGARVGQGQRRATSRNSGHVSASSSWNASSRFLRMFGATMTQQQRRGDQQHDERQRPA